MYFSTIVFKELTETTKNYNNKQTILLIVITQFN